LLVPNTHARSIHENLHLRHRRDRLRVLQDLECGRPMEIDPLVTMVREMGCPTGTPALDAVQALVAQRAKDCRAV
jgi:hypothetical protein